MYSFIKKNTDNFTNQYLQIKRINYIIRNISSFIDI